MNSQKRKWKENIEMILQTNDHVTFIKSIIEYMCGGDIYVE